MHQLHKQLQQQFFHWGWLLPALLPSFQVGGRAAYYILTAIYTIWGLSSLYRSSIRLPKLPLALFILLLGAFLLPATVAFDGVRAADKWLSFAYPSLVFPLTLAALLQHDYVNKPVLQTLLQAWSAGAILTLFLLYIVLAFAWFDADFDPRQHMQEFNLPLLLPFLIALLLQKKQPWLMAGMIIALFIYIVMSEGRAALLGFAVALAITVTLCQGWNLAKTISAAVALLALSFVLSPDILRSAQHSATLLETIDQFTSFRTVLWRQAFANPPESLWFGVGMGNIRYVPEVIWVGDLHLGHLHNWLFDTWYETGLMGLTALLAFIIYPLSKIITAWQHLTVTARFHAGIWLAVAGAILSAGLLSIAYSSPQFAMYLPFTLAVLLYIAISSQHKEHN